MENMAKVSNVRRKVKTWKQAEMNKYKRIPPMYAKWKQAAQHMSSRHRCPTCKKRRNRDPKLKMRERCCFAARLHCFLRSRGRRP